MTPPLPLNKYNPQYKEEYPKWIKQCEANGGSPLEDRTQWQCKVTDRAKVNGQEKGTVIPFRPSPKNSQHLTGASDPKRPTVEVKKGEEFSVAEGKAKGDLKSALNEKGIKGAAEKTYLARFQKFKPTERVNAFQKDLVRVKSLRPDQLRKEISSLWRHPKPEKAPAMPQVDQVIKTLPPDIRPQAEILKQKAGANEVVYSLSGQQLDPAHPMGIPKGTPVLDPPLTRGEALAYLQSRGVTNEKGEPLPGASPEAMWGEATAIQKGEIGPSQLRDNLRAWEREKMVSTLSGDPYKMNGQEITRFMQSKGWLSDHANIESMESFRKRAADPKQVESVKIEVKAANTKGNTPLDQGEKDRAETIIDNLNDKPKKGDVGARGERAGRAEGRSERAKDRAHQIKMTRDEQAFKDKEAREQREFQRQQSSIDRDFKAAEEKKGREFNVVEHQKDRENQMMTTLIQFLGSMITAAMQAMAQVDSAVISGQQQMAGQILGGIRGRG